MLPFILHQALIERYPTASLADVVVLSAYPTGVATCFILSAIFHTLIPHSATGFHFGRQLDFQGIIILMWSASVPMIYYTFHGESGLQKAYWSMVSSFLPGRMFKSADRTVDHRLRSTGKHLDFLIVLSAPRDETFASWNVWLSSTCNFGQRHPRSHRTWLGTPVAEISNVDCRSHSPVQHHWCDGIRDPISRTMVAAAVRHLRRQSPVNALRDCRCGNGMADWYSHRIRQCTYFPRDKLIESSTSHEARREIVDDVIRGSCGPSISSSRFVYL